MWPFDQNNQQMYQQYSQAYDTGNAYGIDNNQMWGHLLQFMQGAPKDMQQRIYQQHFERMPYEQRVVLAQQMPQGYPMDPNDTWSMAQSFHRLGQEQPNMIQRILSHPVLTGVGLGLVGLIAKHAISHHEQNVRREEYAYQQQPQQYGYQQNPYAQQQPYQEQQEVQELRRELRQEESEERREERREERFEEREHRHHRDEW